MKFKEKYQEAMDNITPSDELIQKTKTEMHGTKIKRIKPAYKAIMSFAATAAVVCLVVFGGFPFGGGEASNLFSINTYAKEANSDGTISEKKIDMNDKNEGWGWYSNGKESYVSVGFRCTGENIKSMKLELEDGFFAKNLPAQASEAPKMGIANGVVIFESFNFERLGELITLTEDDIKSDDLLFWGIDNPESTTDIPEFIEIKAIVTFSDNTTQNYYISFNIQNGVGMGVTVQ